MTVDVSPYLQCLESAQRGTNPGSALPKDTSSQHLVSHGPPGVWRSVLRKVAPRHVLVKKLKNKCRRGFLLALALLRQGIHWAAMLAASSCHFLLVATLRHECLSCFLTQFCRLPAEHQIPFTSWTFSQVAYSATCEKAKTIYMCVTAEALSYVNYTFLGVSNFQKSNIY